MPKIATLILAAGSSSRMGKIKQLLPWKNTTLLGHAIEGAKSISEPILVVLGANADIILSDLPAGVKHIINLGWESGMGTSIALGVAQLEETEKPSAIMILLSDQPLIDGAYLNQMLSSFITAKAKIAATRYGSGFGVPAIFSKDFFEELKSLDKDFGAKHLLKKHSKLVLSMDAGGKEIDLDTQENYNSIHTKHGNT